jgi:uncharacterized protein YndB with AHSA1/START domain
MLLITVVVLLVAVGALLAFAATRPDTYVVQRSAAIAAPASVIYPHLDDFHAWPAWSPWEKLDPEMRRTFSGAERGTGAVYAWEGNKKVGQGKMEILAAEPPSRLRIQLSFLKPFESHSVTEFTLAPSGGGTQLTWAMQGNHNLMTKVMCLFKDMDGMVGPDFERGLASLKTIAEAEAAPQPA